MGADLPGAPEALLEEAAWLRRLARSLVDEATAEDVIQETWVAALEARPREDRALRPWLATVLRNFVRLGHRRRVRREARETAASVGEPLPTAEELLAQHESERMVAAAVSALAEPYQSTVLLCYAKGLAPSGIARRQGILPGTVRWRLHEGLAQLRARLDEGHEGRRGAWVALLGPSTGVMIMSAKTKLGVGALLLVLALLGGGQWLRSREATPLVPAVGEARPPVRWAPAREPASERPAGALRVTVTTPDRGPAPGAVVAVARAGAGLPALAGSGATDGAGQVAFDGLGAGTYAVTATARGFAAAVQTGILLDDEQTRTLALVLGRGGWTVSGRVVDASAGAIATARVTATQATSPDDSGGALRFFVTTSDASGGYALALPTGIYTLVADADGYPRKSQMLTLRADATADFRLDPGAALSGRVLWRGKGEPVAGAQVRAVPVERGGYRRPGVETDAEGYFRLPSVAPGEWRVEARKGPLVGATGALRVLPALAIEGLEVLVDPAFTVTGRVVGADGVGAAEMVVTAEPAGQTGGGGALTGADGTFRIQGLTAGRYELATQSRQPDRPRAFGEIAVVDRDVAGVVLVLPAAVGLEGTVRAQDGQPAVGARIYALMGQGDGARDVSRGTVAIADERGSFAFRGLDPGGLSLWADLKDRGIATWGPEVVEAGERRRVALVLGPGATLTGAVTFADGAPAVGAMVSVLAPDRAAAAPDERRGRSSRVVVGPDGRYRVAGIIAGWARATAHRSAPASFAGATRLELAAGDNHLDFMIPRPASLRGVVRTADGRPAVGAVVVASTGEIAPPPTHRQRAIADVDGSFVIDDLDAGASYRLWADLPGQAATVRAVAGGSAVALDLVQGSRQRR